MIVDDMGESVVIVGRDLGLLLTSSYSKDACKKLYVHWLINLKNKYISK